MSARRLCTVLLLSAACSSAAVEPERAPELAAGGKADALDPCDADERYGDGVCDTECLEPDPDCDDEDGRPACGGPTEWGCEPTEFCKLAIDASCGPWGDELGHCTVIPDACDGPQWPVCGCDGVSYPSECDAEREQVSVMHEGICIPSPGEERPCGGWLGNTCDPDQYCRWGELAACGQVDHPGACTDVPQASECPQLVDPVCGCDGETYINDCLARAARKSIQHHGPC